MMQSVSSLVNAAIFFIIEAILQGKRTAIGLPELFDPQVQRDLRSLARDLSELADQGI